MQKMLKPKPAPKTTPLKQVKSAKNIEELLKIPNLHFRLNDKDIKTVGQFNKEMPLLDYGVNAINIEVNYDDDAVNLKLVEQPECCANLLMYDLNIYCSTGNAGVAAVALFKLTKFMANIDGYSYIWFTHRHDDSSVLIAKRHCGFTVTRTYINKRTGNRLVDLHLEV